MRKTAALYPFCSEFLPFVRHFEELQKQYTLKQLISPEGVGVVGRDAGYSCNQRDTGHLVHATPNLEKQSWDELLVMKSINTNITNEDEKLQKIVERTLKAGKMVSYFAESAADVSSVFSEYAKIYSEKIQCNTEGFYIKGKDRTNEMYGEINTPVILVGGLLREADVLEVLIQLVIQLNKDGYCPAVLTQHPLGRLFGFTSISHFFNNKSITESDKTVALNLFVKNLEATVMPDVIIVEAPDAVMQFSNYDPNGFGIQSYMLRYAIPPDYFICCVPYLLGVGSFVEAISEDFKIRLGVPISAIHVSNILIDSTDLIQTHKISYVRVNSEDVYEQLKKEKENSKIPLYNVVADGIYGIYESLKSGGIL